MSKTELKIWLVWLAITAVGAVLAFVVPLQWMAVLFFLAFIFFWIVFGPAMVFYSLCAFGLSALLSLVLPKRGWIRLVIAAAAVWGGAHMVSMHLNAPRLKAFAQMAAQDVPLTRRPSFARLVIIDDRDNPDTPLSSLECANTCIPYLANGQVQAVLLPADPADRQPLAQRAYRIFTQRSNCAPAKGLEGAHRIWKGGCLAKEQTGSLATGDLIVHTLRVNPPYTSPDCRCERVEVTLMTAGGPQIIERQTTFSMARYHDMPVPGRDAGFHGTQSYDNGLAWMHAWMEHAGRSQYSVLEKDLKLNPEVYWTLQ